MDIEAVQRRIVEKETMLSKMNRERNTKGARMEVLSELVAVKATNLETMRAEEAALKTTVEAMVSVGFELRDLKNQTCFFQAPQEEFRKCVEELLKFSNTDIKTLSKITKPSVGIRLCCEMLRTIFEPNFKPSRFFSAFRIASGTQNNCYRTARGRSLDGILKICERQGVFHQAGHL